MRGQNGGPRTLRTPPGSTGGNPPGGEKPPDGESHGYSGLPRDAVRPAGAIPTPPRYPERRQVTTSTSRWPRPSPSSARTGVTPWNTRASFRSAAVIGTPLHPWALIAVKVWRVPPLVELPSAPTSRRKHRRTNCDGPTQALPYGTWRPVNGSSLAYRMGGGGAEGAQANCSTLSRASRSALPPWPASRPRRRIRPPRTDCAGGARRR